jgi:carbon-monoxide dehydrogenase medium subunit
VKKFDHLSPNSVGEAVSLLANHRGTSRVLAGGTDLINLMSNGEISPEVLVSLKSIKEYRDVKRQNGMLSIGAFCTLRSVAASPLIKSKYKIMRNAIQQMGSVQIRNRGTIGGNLCNASPAADTAAPLMVLDANMIIEGPQGRRKESIKDFFTGPGQTILAIDEILTEITLPEPKDKGDGIYLKLGKRKAMEIAIVGVAVYLVLDSAGKKFNDIRIAISSAVPKPLRVSRAESILKNRIPDKRLIDKTALAVSSASDPITDFRASKEYRREMVCVLTARAITEVINRLKRQQLQA